MLRIQKSVKEVKSVKDYTAAASEVREENARTVERLAKKRSRTATHNLILQVSLAAAVAAVIYLSAAMQYRPIEIAAYAAGVTWILLWLFANREE